ncbi:PadR family transcriptional regulator [Paenibacillaceae bacterium]|nr:PadR family transcriptional regulator [Paenibacillaceae bacterium]
MKVSKELMKGSTVVLILSLLQEKEMYGYELSKEMEKRSEGVFALKEGTLYPILHALESEEWVEARWSEHDGRRRKYYKITADGIKQLANKRKEWAVYRGAVERVLGEGYA